MHIIPFKGSHRLPLSAKKYIMDKITHLYQQWKALQPLSKRKEYLLSQRFTVDYNYNSNHIEGNTLTYGQT